MLDDYDYTSEVSVTTVQDDIEQSFNSLGFDLDVVTGDTKALIEQLVASKSWDADSATSLMKYLIDDNLSDDEALVILVEADLAGLVDMTLDELKDKVDDANKSTETIIITTIPPEPELPPEIASSWFLFGLDDILASIVNNIAFRLEQFVSNAFGTEGED